MHESQSRLWENAVGRSRPFWTYWFPMARRIFHEALADVTLDEFHAAVNHVAPSLIRVQADEVDLQPAHHRPLRAGAGTALRRPGRRRPPRCLEPEVPRKPWASRPATTPKAAFRTSTGAPGSSAIFRPTRWATSTPPSSSPRPRPSSAASTTPSPGATSAACSAGSARRSIAKASAIGPRNLIEHVTGSKPDHRPLIDGLQRKYPSCTESDNDALVHRSDPRRRSSDLGDREPAPISPRDIAPCRRRGWPRSTPTAGW